MKSATTRERILRQGVDLITTSGISGVTLGVLANDAGVSKSGLFAHFKSREDLQIDLLERSAQIAQEHVVMPAMRVRKGLPRLKALLNNWLGWTSKAGLPGGCPVAAALFELDDHANGPVRRRVLAMESEWRGLLARSIREAIDCGHLRRNLDVDQLVWELCGIYLSHHASFRFVRDPRADSRAHTALRFLIDRARPKPSPRTKSSRKEIRRAH